MPSEGRTPFPQESDVQLPENLCGFCGGDGWYVDHEDACYEDGDCHCSGVQRQCEPCQGTGKRDA